VPLPTTLQTELRHILRAFRAAHGAAAVPGGAGKALEAWLLMKLAQTATLLPAWEVSLRQGDGTPLPRGATFRLPAQRSAIPASNAAASGYVLLERQLEPEHRLELHGSLQWRGRSNAKHECDISVVPALIGEAIRDNGGGYPHGLPVVAIECKDKTISGTLDETRQTLARMFDLALVTQPYPGWSCRIFEKNTHQPWGRKSSKYVAFFAKGTFGVARAGGFQRGAHSLGGHYHIRRYEAIYATASGSLGALLQSFRTTLARIDEF
jgi:hypothetical protein